MYTTNVNARTRGAAWLIMLALLAAIIPLGLQAAPVLPITGVFFEDAATQTNDVATQTPEPSIPVESVDPSPEPSPLESVVPGEFMLGDADCNLKVNINDILLIRDVIFGVKELSDQGFANVRLKVGDNVAIDQILLIRDVIFFGA